jgi:outer membrane protein insertion porin family
MKGMDGSARPTTRAAAARAILVLALLAAVALWFGPSLTRGQQGKELVADVTFVGNKSVPTDKAMRYVHTRKNMEYSRASVQADLDRLAETHLFKNIRARTEPTADGRVLVFFDVQEHPKVVREIIYKHAKHLTEKELDNITGIRKGAPLDKTVNQLACYKIQEYLQKKGRMHANVTLEEGFDEGHDRVVFNITEGPVVRVRTIDFTGNKELATTARLRSSQVDTGRHFLGFGGVFQPQMVEGDKLKLEDYYRTNGYLNVHVAPEIVWSDDLQYVDILFHIREGTRYRVKKVNVEGSNSFPGEQLSSIVQAKAGEFYNDNVVGNDVKNMTDYAGWRGYQVKVDKNLSLVPNEPGVINVQYTVNEQAPAKVGQVIIVGNDVTQDRVIRRVLGLYPGQTLRYPELRIAERDLARLNIFDVNAEQGIRPTVEALPSPDDSEFRDVLVTVKEAHTGSIMIGAGVNSNSGLMGSFVVNEKNFDLFKLPTSWADIWEGRAFRGAGQELRLEAVPGTQLQRYTITFREPFLFDRPYSLTTSGYYYQRYFNEYTEERIGGRINVGHQISRGWTVNGGVRLEDVKVLSVGLGAPVDYTSAIGDNTVIGPNVGLTWDTRDSYLRPTEGGILNTTFEQVFGTYNFPLFNVEGSRYFTTWQRPDGSGKQVFSVRNQFGFAGSNTPVFERYFAGGFNSIRGFQFRGVGPWVDGFNVGGDFLMLNSLEYQVPIRANDQIYFVAFIDGGTVEKNISIHDYRVSAGFGVRLTVPMLGPVPIALDFGFPINRTGNDREQIFNFWFGAYR